MGVQSVLGGEMKWCAEFEAAPSKILAHHWPDTPNLGDVTKIDWHAVEPVDIITGGSPCQDLSHAGKRAGMKAGTRSGLWASMCDAIDIIRPRLVVWENVRGALSAEADSAMEQCPRCVGDPRDRGPVLRALGRVLGDLAELGYDAWWYGLRAADVGAAHGRFRIFLFAQPADADHQGLEGLGDQTRASQAGRHGHVEPGAGGPALTLLPTPVVDHSRGLPSASTDYASLPNVAVSLVPSAVQDWREYEAAIRRQERAFGRPAPTPTEVSEKSRKGCAIHGDSKEGRPAKELRNLRGSADPQEVRERPTGGQGCVSEADALLPVVCEQQAISEEGHGTLASQAASRSGVRGMRGHGATPRPPHRPESDEQRPSESLDLVCELSSETALAGGSSGEAGCESVGTRCTCKPRLSPKFCEWLMGLPEAHVTGVPGVSRNDQLKALGNGVCPQQAAAAARAFLNDQRTGRSAA